MSVDLPPPPAPIEQTQSASPTQPLPPGFSLEPATEQPGVSPKSSNEPLPPHIMQAAETVLPVFPVRALTPERARTPDMKYKGYQWLQEQGIYSHPERVWEVSGGGLVLIGRSGANHAGERTYYGLTAAHVTGLQRADGTIPPDEQRSVLTPGGDVQDLRMLGLVQDANDPNYRGRDLALVSFPSKEIMPVAAKAGLSPGTAQSGKGFNIGFPHELSQSGGAIVADPNVAIFPAQIKRDGTPNLTHGDLIAQKTIDPVRLSGQLENVSDADNGNFNLNNLQPYKDSNTKTGNSGGGVFNSDGKLVAIHTMSDIKPDGLGGPTKGWGVPIDTKTAGLVQTMIQRDMAQHGLQPEPMSGMPAQPTAVKQYSSLQIQHGELRSKPSPQTGNHFTSQPQSTNPEASSHSDTKPRAPTPAFSF